MDTPKKSLSMEVYYYIVVFPNNNTYLMNYIRCKNWSDTITMFNKCSIQVNVALVIIKQLFSNKKIKNEYINCYFDS